MNFKIGEKIRIFKSSKGTINLTIVKVGYHNTHIEARTDSNRCFWYFKPYQWNDANGVVYYQINDKNEVINGG